MQRLDNMKKSQRGERAPETAQARSALGGCPVFASFVFLLGCGVILSFTSRVGAATTIFCVAIFLFILDKVSAIDARTSNANIELQALQRAIYHLDCACDDQQYYGQALSKVEVSASEGASHVRHARYELKRLCEQAERGLLK
ncbi:hypothetical protein AWB69_08373 [Caballeronia udeis]|uniref:Uncharacterized protein n=1 Tax=Caballeronia udeis TaxID=1232866 RepID=A0A158JNZ0_9BURK|nr:hypothetical protein [Caballeronia udeis]SAL70566.1 hypothetical protein AWB69_08373 [Caballeronia udeis]